MGQSRGALCVDGCGVLRSFQRGSRRQTSLFHCVLMFLNSQEEPLKATLFGTTVDSVNAKYLLVTSCKIRLQYFVDYMDSSDTHVASITCASKIGQTYSQL